MLYPKSLPLDASENISVLATVHCINPPKHFSISKPRPTTVFTSMLLHTLAQFCCLCTTCDSKVIPYVVWCALRIYVSLRLEAGFNQAVLRAASYTVGLANELFGDIGL